MFKKLSKLGQALMLPISILPVAGLLLGLGGALTNPATIQAFPFLDMNWLQAILQVMNAAGNAVFGNLPLIFAIGIAAGLADGDKGTAGLAGAVSFVVFSGTLEILASLFLGEGAVIDTGVLGAIVIGLTVVYLHNKYRKIQLPQFLGFFGGSRFIPIVASLAAIVIGGIFFLIWPPIQEAMVIAGQYIAQMGSIGSFLYGFLLRLTGAVGLHHAVYPLFWYTELGGTEMVAGEAISGAQNIFFAQLADPSHTGLYTYGSRFFAGRFATMMFGLPAAAIAMLQSLPKENRKKNTGLYVSNAFTSFFTGITEPIEYSFLFAAPWLYVIHALLDGLSFFFADILNIRIANSFSGGLIDYLLFGVLQGNDSTNWIRVIPLGLVWALVYYIVFRFCISKFKVAIPGSEVETEEQVSETSAESKESTLAEEAQIIITALGDEANIENVTACATRLRVSVSDNQIVDKESIQKLGASAVFEVDGGVQAVFGGKANILSQEINQKLGKDD
jgi:PTS system glucose-specific IIC component